MSLRTQRIDINPLRDFRYVANATRYAALDMFASQTRDLYHIETDHKGGYIEFAVRQIYRAEHSEAYRQKPDIHLSLITFSLPQSASQTGQIVKQVQHPRKPQKEISN